MHGERDPFAEKDPPTWPAGWWWGGWPYQASSWHSWRIWVARTAQSMGQAGGKARSRSPSPSSGRVRSVKGVILLKPDADSKGKDTKTEVKKSKAARDKAKGKAKDDAASPGKGVKVKAPRKLPPALEEILKTSERLLGETRVVCADDVNEVRAVGRSRVAFVLIAAQSRVDCVDLAAEVRARQIGSFVSVFHAEATESPYFRQQCWKAGANMVTHNASAVARVLQDLNAEAKSGGRLMCPYRQCGRRTGFSEDQLWKHLQLFHCNHPNVPDACPLCGARSRSLQVHFRNKHGPVGRGELESEEHLRTGLFAIVIVRRPRDGKFLMTQEFAQTGFWVPGGQVDPGESLREGAIREVLEEAGVTVEIKGMLEFQVRSKHWLRAVFYAEPAPTPVDEQPAPEPKTYPCYESSGAVWVSIDQLFDKSRPLKFRSASEPTRWFPFLAKGGKPGPLEIPERYKEYVKSREVRL